jgi:hypothetical protein
MVNMGRGHSACFENNQRKSKMARGGNRPGAGRKPGAATKRTREIADKAASEGLTPLDYLLSVLRDETQEQAVRIDAANKAAPYMHPKLAAVDHKSSDGTMTPQPARVEIVAVDGDGTG